MSILDNMNAIKELGHELSSMRLQPNETTTDDIIIVLQKMLELIAKVESRARLGF